MRIVSTPGSCGEVHEPDRFGRRHQQRRKVRADRERGENRDSDIICEAAYYYAERRGFVPGRELEDWLAAELQIDEFMTGRYRY